MSAIRARAVGKDYRRNDNVVRRGDKHWALRDVTFDVGSGETVGLIGRNGSGKSTLLRVAAGITQPTTGSMEVTGQRAGVLSLGEGFHTLLSGRENATTALMLNGYSRGEARGRVGAIEEFVELGDYFDEPIRTYSSGMFVRLAFGVALNVDADVLLIDEALAVGDLSFSSKCIDQIEARQRRGATMLLASHDLGQIEQLCDRVIWLADGAIEGMGPASVVGASYQREAHEETVRRSAVDATPHRLGSHEVTIDEVVVSQADSRPGSSVRSGEPVVIELTWSAHQPVPDALFGVSIHHEDGNQCLDVSSMPVEVGSGRGAGTVLLHIDRLDLGAGRYHVDVGAYTNDWAYAYDYQWQARWFDVIGVSSGPGYLPPCRWVSR